MVLTMQPSDTESLLERLCGLWPVLFGNKLTWPESAESNPRPFAVGPFLSEAKCWGLR